MRACRRNQRVIWYSNRVGEAYVLDENGERTSERYVNYSLPHELRCCVSSGAGEWSGNEFGGTFTNYDRSLYLCDSSPVNIGDRIWIGADPTLPHNYEVTAVREALHECHILVKEVPSGRPSY